jgi:hypothetical protein
MGDTVILKKNSDLSKIGVIPKLFKQDTYRPNETGEYEGEYRGNSLLGSKRNITPFWDSVKGQWSFEGTVQDLQRIQTALRLRDSKGELIPISNDSLTNRLDPFWAHQELYNVRDLDMVEGSAALSSDNPLQELMMRVYRGSDSVIQENKKQSKLVSGGADLKLESPTIMEEKKVKDIDKNLKASTLLLNMGEARQKAVLAIMNPATYNYNENDPTRLKNTLYHECAMDTKPNKRFGGMTSQEKFIQLAEMPDEKLSNMSMIMKAVLLGHITPNHKIGYSYKGELLNEGKIKNDQQLIDFLFELENGELYFEIAELVKD